MEKYRAKSIPFDFQLKSLCAVAISLTVLSLFVAHDTNPLRVITHISAPLSPNKLYSQLRTSTHSTSHECHGPNENKYSEIHKPLDSQTTSQYAYIHCIDLNIDITEQMYGIIAFHGGLIRTKSRQDHVVLIPLSKRADLLAINSQEMIDRVTNILTDSITSNQFHVISFDSTEIDDAFTANPHHSQFRDTFHAAHAFKHIEPLSKYEKMVLVEYNMVILSNNVDVVFNYPVPAAPPERWSGLESNIACFLFSVTDNTIYEHILSHLKDDVYVWYNDEDNKNAEINNNPVKWSADSWNTERGTFQSLMNAIYWKREDGFNGINQMHQRFAVNTNKLSNRRTKYFVEHRPNMLNIIEFVDDYPPTRKARDRCVVRSNKMIQDHYKLDWFEVAMNTYFVQFWLDMNGICGDTQYDSICNKLDLQYKKEVAVSLLYKTKYGYPYPHANVD
eukprot:70382_1